MLRVKSISYVSLCALCLGISALAQVEPERNTAAGKLLFKNPDLFVVNQTQYPHELPAAIAEETRDQLGRLGLSDEQGAVDLRTLRFATMMPALPLLPGTGMGNNLTWSGLASKKPTSPAELEGAAWQVFVEWLSANEESLQIDVAELAQPSRVAVHDNGDLIQIVARRQINGIPVRDSVLNAVINHGNLILFGARNWADVTLPLSSGHLSLVDAQHEVNQFLGNTTHQGFKGKGELMIVPFQRGELGTFPLGEGLDYRLVWVVEPNISEEIAEYSAMVDAYSGEVLSFEDTVHYAASNHPEGPLSDEKGTTSTRSVVGGVYPVNNTGVGAAGTEQPGFPMPFVDVVVGSDTLYTDTGGNLSRCVGGTIRSHLSGLYVTMNDTCGLADETSTSGIDLGQSSGTDCVVPSGHSAGDTHASRTGYYELNRIMEMARGQLPNNTWLTEQLQSNMNIVNTCNATWNGSQVNFYRTGGGCGNTGEIAAIFDHEWGHGMDDNDVEGTVGFPGEGIADIYSTLRLNESCVGAGFRVAANCAGYGDNCLSCTGVRDVDWAKHSVGLPWNMDYIFSTGPWVGRGCGGCSGTSHCEGHLISSAVWDLIHRKLTAAPYNLDLNTALEIGTRLTYLGAGPTSVWFDCDANSSFNGCSAGSGYLNYLAADDDNGNLADGTPHMTAIYTAFNDHEVACATPAPQDSGCAGAPTSAPAVTGQAVDRGVSLSWSSVSGATRYKIYRTEGVFECDFGKVLVAETSATSYLDLGLANDFDYSYIVIAFAASDACFGPASTCTTVAPVAGPNLSAFYDGTLTAADGDDDQFVDNCETVTVGMSASNIGNATQTNVRILSAICTSHPDSVINTQFPLTLSASMAACDESTAQIELIPDGLVFGDTLTLVVEVTSDQLGGRVIETTIEIAQTESDLESVPSQSFTFESSLEGWTVAKGIFARTAGSGANGSAFYMQSSANLDDQCDRIDSPLIVTTSATVISVQNNYDIEDFSGQWWDRANLGLSTSDGSRVSITPSSGRLYNATSIGGACETAGEDGWAGTQSAWALSTVSAANVTAAGVNGLPVQLSIIYGTDSGTAGTGFRFDDVTITNFYRVVADANSDACVAACPSDWAAWPDDSVLRLIPCLDGLFIPSR